MANVQISLNGLIEIKYPSKRLNFILIKSDEQMSGYLT
jgi:hypothetical protein